MKECYYVPKDDKQPRGTIIKSIMDKGDLYFIQVGSEEKPEWLPLGDFYEFVFVNAQQSFIYDCIRMYDVQMKKIKEMMENIN